MLAEKLLEIQDLGDLGLACLLCLVAQQHGIITSNEDSIDDVAYALEQLCSQGLDLSTATIDCAQGITLDAFREGILVDPGQGYDHSPSDTPRHERPLPSFSQVYTRPRLPSLDERKIANVVIVKNLDLASPNIQIQALELIRTRRVYSHIAMHAASKVFLLIALNAADTGHKMNKHLNDLFSICHRHRPEDDDTVSDQMSVRLRREGSTSDTASLSSLYRQQAPSHTRPIRAIPPTVSHSDLTELRNLAAEVKMTAEVSAYIHNVVISMRLHRYVAGGISALATRQLKETVKALAVLHGLAYVTPSLVALGVHKTYPHRLVLATAETERSLRWGSDRAAVAESLRGVTKEVAIDAVLDSVETPL